MADLDLDELTKAKAQLAFLAEGCSVTGLDHLPVVSRANAESFAKDMRVVLAALERAEKALREIEQMGLLGPSGIARAYFEATSHD